MIAFTADDMLTPIPQVAYTRVRRSHLHRPTLSTTITFTVEYAMEAISHAGSVLGVLAKDGVVLAAEKRVTGKLLDLSSAKEGGGYGGSGEKMFLLNSCVPPFILPTVPPLIAGFGHRNVIGGVAGITSDANSLVNYARSVAQKHLLQYNQDIPVEQLAQRLCDMKQGYTQYGGTSTLARPLPFLHDSLF